MEGTRTVISKSAKKRSVKQGFAFTEQVVYKTPYKKNGKTYYESQTRHEISK